MTPSDPLNPLNPLDSRAASASRYDDAATIPEAAPSAALAASQPPHAGPTGRPRRDVSRRAVVPGAAGAAASMASRPT